MPQEFTQPPRRKIPERLSAPEKSIQSVRTLFDEAEAALVAQDRKLAEQLSRRVYTSLLKLNKETIRFFKPLENWNPKGDMTDIEFKELKARFEKLSRDMGVGAVVEFPPITAKDLEEINSLHIKLFGLVNSKNDIVPSFAAYTGTGESLGAGDIYVNSRATTWQLLFALALTRHKLVKDIVAGLDGGSKTIDAKILVDNQVMWGLNILDMGCGKKPVFARCARIMGANVWTVDTLSAEDFLFKEGEFPKDQRKLEIANHIQLNLFDPEAAQKIIAISGGNFNLVTEANLISSLFSGGKNIAKQVLKEGGVYEEATMHEGELKSQLDV